MLLLSEKLCDFPGRPCDVSSVSLVITKRGTEEAKDYTKNDLLIY